jgi:hypothetical protein
MKSLVSRAGGRFGYRCNWVRSYARYRSSQSIIQTVQPRTFESSQTYPKVNPKRDVSISSGWSNLPCLAPPPPSTFRYFDSRRCKCPEPRCAPRRQRRGHRVHSSRCYVFFCVVAYLPALLTLVPPPSNLSVTWPWQQWWAIARYSWAVDWYTFLRKPASLSRIFLCG